MLKAMKKPPDLIKRLFDCVLILLEEMLEPAEAEMVKAAAAARSLVEVGDQDDGAVDLPREPAALPEGRDQRRDDRVALPVLAAEDMNYEDAKKASGNVAGLCIWVNSMVLYTAIAKEVKPKMARSRWPRASSTSRTNKLDRRAGPARRVQADLDKMQAQFDEAMAEEGGHRGRRRRDAEADGRGQQADRRLSGEHALDRRLEAFADEIRRLAGDVALACAFVCYAGPFNADFRTHAARERF